MRNELDNPAMLGRAIAGDARARRVIGMVVDAAVDGFVAAGPEVYYRTSSVDPALSAYSTRARGLLGISGKNWRAHHLIPFAVMAAMPVTSQKAVVASGWRMDSSENLIALPANMVTYVAPPNSSRFSVHNSPHRTYSSVVAARCALIASDASSMETSVLRTALGDVEIEMREYLTRRFLSVHPVLQ